jgi:tetratricopeptide (TPR) repeat protein
MTACVLVLLLAAGCGPQGRDQLLLGQRLIREGRPAEAIEPLQAAAQAFQTNTAAAAQILNYLGLAYHQAGRPAEAAQAYKAALDKDFNLFAARYNRGALFFEQGNLPAAINELTTYTAHQPKDPAGWLLLGKAQLRAGLYDAADRNLLQALRLNPSPQQQAEGLNALGMGQAQRRRAREAFQYFEAALNRVTNYPPALLNQAVLSQQLQDRNFALQKYAAYLAAGSNAPNADAIRALTNQLASQLALALKPTSPPTNQAPATNLVLNVRTASPPAVVRTSPPPSLVQTAAPPAIARTGPPPAEMTARPLPVSSNLVAQTAPPSTKPPAETAPPRGDRTTTAVRAVTAPEVPPAQPEPPLERVQLDAEPEIKPAVDVALARPTAVASSTNSVSPAPAPATGGSATTSPPATTTAAETEDEKAPKRSLIARLNPLNLFRGDEDPEKAREREAKKAAGQARKAEKEAAKKHTTPVTRQPAPAPALVQPTTPAPPTFTRYAYTAPAAPPPGNRAESERQVAEGLAAHKAGRPGDAQAAYTRAVRADPANFQAQFNLAVAAYENQDWPRSLAAYELALALAPDDTRARYGFALALERAGYPLDAAAELERILAREPGNVDAHLALANLNATTLGNTVRAREHYLKVLQLQPNHPQAGLIKRWLGPAYRP